MRSNALKVGMHIESNDIRVCGRAHLGTMETVAAVRSPDL
jgi:hypothetical protein